MQTYAEESQHKKQQTAAAFSGTPVKHTPVQYLEDNRRAVMQQKQVNTLEKKQPAVQAKVVQRVVLPGLPVPTEQQQLAYRFKQIKDESGVGHTAILNEMPALLNANLPVPADPVLDHPLAEPPPGMARDMVIVSLYEQLQQNNNAQEGVDFFGTAVLNRAIGKAIAQNLGSDKEIIDGIADAISDIVPLYYDQAEHAAILNPLNTPDRDLAASVGGIAPGPGLMARAATQHLGANVRPAFAEPNAIQKAQLREALLRMPIVQSMLNGELGTQGGSAHLMNGIEGVGGAQPTGELIEKIQEALGILGHLVDSGVLPAQARVPNVKVNLDPFRAFANRDDNGVNISVLTDIDVIVHEFAHQIEFALPVEEWRDIQELVRMRDQGGPLVSIYPDSANQQEREEAAFNSIMPATGLYSAKAYDDGSTEVMSMTMEYFSTPQKAQIMIDNDPLQAAIILRIIKRDEFDKYVPNNVRELLPRGDISPHINTVAPDPMNRHPGDEIGDDQL